jgi:hypothetical protein
MAILKLKNSYLIANYLIKAVKEKPFILYYGLLIIFFIYLLDISLAKAQIYDVNVNNFSQSSNSKLNLRPNDVVHKIYYNKECFVWFEINSQKNLNAYFQNFDSWQTVGNPIITSRISNVESLTKQLIDANIPIISGFKTSDVFKKKSYYNIDLWAKVASVSRNLSKMTNGRAVVLENETALKNLLAEGISSINYDKLLSSIVVQQWPEIWFWHAPVGEKQPTQTLSTDIARVIMQGIPKARLIEPSSTGFICSSTNAISKMNLEKTFSLDKNPISIIYLDDNKRNFWKLENTKQAIKQASGNTVIIYPGYNNIANSASVLKGLGLKKIQ